MATRVIGLGRPGRCLLESSGRCDSPVRLRPQASAPNVIVEGESCVRHADDVHKKVNDYAFIFSAIAAGVAEGVREARKETS